MQRLANLMHDAQKDFLIISPYFVPHDAGVKAAGELTHRGVRIAVLTNSLAATDAVAVQAGYSPYRVPLLQQGVELYEFKPRRKTPRAGHRRLAFARQPACEDLCDRPQDSGDRLDEPRSALGQSEHRAGAGDP